MIIGGIKMVVNDIIITSLETINAFDITTGAYLFTLDERQDATIEQTQDSQEITGKQGRKLATLKRNKAVSISGTNGILSGGLLELQTGSKFSDGNVEVMWTDYLTVNNNTATTSWKAIGAAGSEIKELYLKDENGNLTLKKEQAADSPSEGKFTYNPGTKLITFNTSEVADGTEIFVAYKRKISASQLVNDSGKYSEKCMLYVDAIGEDKCAHIYRVQFFIPKADFNGEFSIELGGDQVTHEFSADALSGACGTHGQFFTYTVFGANTADVE